MGQAVGTSVDPLLEKILDPALRAFAESGSTEEDRSVIIELAPGGVRPLRTRGLPPKDVTAKPKRSASQPLTERAALMNELENKIAAVVSRKRVRLNAAEAFVLNVRPRELRALVQSSLVGAVRPNRVHRT